MDTSGDGPLVPTHWNDKDKSPLLEVTQGLQVKYLGLGESDKDAAAVRTNNPIPPSVGHFYFEITIKNKGRDGYIGIGLCAGSTSMNRLPGWEKHSYGYHGDDGNAFCFSGTGKKYGPTFSSDDVIGCCVNFLDHTCFYTKNGQKLEVAFRDLDRKEGVGKSPTKLYPCVGLRTPGEEIEANFGQTPFVFDIESEISELRQRAHRMVTSTVLDSKGWQQQLNQIVTSYLVHHGHSATAQILARDMDTAIDEPEPTIIKRQQIRKCVMDGDIDGAIGKVQADFPTIFTEKPQLLFRVKCRRFVEMIGTSSEEVALNDDHLSEILSFGQEIQAMCEAPEVGTPENRTLLKEAFSMLAYTNPRVGPMAYLLEPQLREPLALELNSAILESLQLPGRPKLELIVRQASACLEEMRRQEMGQAAFLSVNEFL